MYESLRTHIEKRYKKINKNNWFHKETCTDYSLVFNLGREGTYSEKKTTKFVQTTYINMSLKIYNYLEVYQVTDA